MDEFRQYLHGQRLKDSTIEEHCKNIQRFTGWMIQENYPDASTIKYTDLLAYIQYEKSRGIDAATINLRLTSIRYYFEHLKKLGAVEKNPAKTIRVKGVVKKVIEHPLSMDELQTLYHEYSRLQKNTHVQGKTDASHQRNTVIAGLLIFQGVHSGELQKMETSHINLKEGIVYIPSTSKGNNRQLSLSPAQMLPLHVYLSEVRLLLKPVADELIPGSVRNIILQLVQELQGINPIIKNALHVRGSVILQWLKLHNKRQVQYMAGHKYISSTEKYAEQQVETLQDELGKHHPFG
jgi:site-specific recombinase XerD